MRTRFEASQHSRRFPVHLRVCPGGPGESCRVRPAGGILESLGFCRSSSFFLVPLEKRVFIPLLIARWREQTPVSTAQPEYFITRRKTRWRAGDVGHPLSPPFPSLGSGPGRHHLGGFLPVGDFMLQLWAQRWACYRVLVGRRPARP